MALKTKDINVNGFKQLFYVTRKEDEQGNLIPYTSVNGTVISEEEFELQDGSTESLTTMVQLPDLSKVAARPIIILLQAPQLSHDFFVTTPQSVWRTAIFLHIDQAVSYVAKEVSGNNNPDRIFEFKASEQGLHIQDTSKPSGTLFTPDSLVALGVLSNTASWDYYDKVLSWFEPNRKTPTYVKPKSKFLTDIAKIPLGQGLLNGDGWDMT